MDNKIGAVVRRIIVRAKGRGGGQWAIVELDDGRLGITQDAKLLQTLRFNTDDVEGCIREFVRRTGLPDCDPRQP